MTTVTAGDGSPESRRRADAHPRATPVRRVTRARRGARISRAVDQRRRARRRSPRCTFAKRSRRSRISIGAVDVEDVLDEVFRRFCVGK